MPKQLSLEEIKTIDYYNIHAVEWSNKHSGGTMFIPEMEILFQLLPEGKILEVGSGHGGDAQMLIQHYGVNNYLGCDASKGLIEIAQKNNPKANFLNISVYELSTLNRQFDGFWISAMLIHIPKDKLQEALGEIHGVTKANGIGFVSVMEGKADMEESRPERHYSLWMPEEFEKEITQARFKIVNFRRIETNASPWLAYILKSI